MGHYPSITIKKELKLKDYFISGFEIYEAAMGDQSLTQYILNQNMIYSYAGFEFNQPEFDDVYYDKIASIFFESANTSGLSIFFFSVHGEILSDSPLTKKKGYWGRYCHDAGTIPKIRIDRTAPVGNMIRLWSISSIDSSTSLSPLILYSLHSTSGFILSSKNLEEVASEIESTLSHELQSTKSISWPHDFIKIIMEKLINHMDYIVFATGGFDYGGIYLNAVSGSHRENKPLFAQDGPPLGAV